MSDWRVLITDGLEESGQAILRARARPDDRSGISPEDLLDAIGEYDALIVRGRTRVTAAVIQATDRLRVIGRAGVGVDNIDLGAAQAQGVMVVNAPTATSLAVAEHTLALMLSLARTVPRADAAMKAGQWTKKALHGVELAGKTLGIIGMGHIGSAVAHRAAAFEMSVLGYDPLITAAQIQRAGAEPVERSELYARSDFITLHVPLTPDTRGMIDGQAIAAMKRGVRLICTARGGVIDETALLASLESGQVAGAALDVFATEPPGLTALVAHQHVIATPHIAGQTNEAQIRAGQDIAREVLAALAGDPLHWRVV